MAATGCVAGGAPGSCPPAGPVRRAERRRRRPDAQHARCVRRCRHGGRGDGGTVQAGDPFAKSTTTANGYLTYDADMIDIDKVVERGRRGLRRGPRHGPRAQLEGLLPGRPRGAGAGHRLRPADPVHPREGPLRPERGRGEAPDRVLRGSRTSSHGTHVASTIIGYSYRSNTDASQGFALPAIQVRGIAPKATIIPIRVLNDYNISLPGCTDPRSSRAR